MNELRIELADQDRGLAPGERLDFAVYWELAERPECVEARLVWYTRGKGTQDLSLIDSHRFDSPSLSETRECSFTMPAGPYSFSGKLISLIWAVEVIVQPSDLSRRVDFVMAPDGREILLRRDEP